MLNDYRKANKTGRDVAAQFSAGREDLPALVAGLIQENKKLHHRANRLEEIACRVEAEELLNEARVRTTSGSERITSSSSEQRHDGEAVKYNSRGLSAQRDTPGPYGQAISDRERIKEESQPCVIAKVFDGRDADSLKHLALALIAHKNVVTLLGSRDDETARLVFARSGDAPGDMNALMRECCEIISGRGGGRSDMAQGGGPGIERLDEAISCAADRLIS